MLQFIQNIDNAIILYIQNNMHNPILDRFMIFITTIGNAGAIWIIISSLLLLSKKYRKIGVISIFSFLLAVLLGESLLKNIVQRSRPFENFEAIKVLISKPASYSFPSGHSGFAFAVTGVLAKYFRKNRFLLYIFASLMAFSRVYLFVHYPSDVISGAILGLVCSKISFYILDSENNDFNISI